MTPPKFTSATRFSGDRCESVSDYRKRFATLLCILRKGGERFGDPLIYRSLSRSNTHPSQGTSHIENTVMHPLLHLTQSRTAGSSLPAIFSDVFLNPSVIYGVPFDIIKYLKNNAYQTLRNRYGTVEKM